MKKQLLVAAMVMISAISLGQKKELKKTEKAIKAGEFTEAMSLLTTAEGMIAGADNDLQAQFYLLKGKALIGNAKDDFEMLNTAAKSLTKATDLGADTSEASNSLVSSLISSAINDQNDKKYETATKKLYTSYQLSKKDTIYLYYAAGNAINGKDYDSAITYYRDLIDMGFTGKVKQYTAVEKATGEVKSFNDKKERDIYVKTGEFIKPETSISESKRGEILKNLTLIYTEKNQIEEALKIIKNARSENPEDVDLMKVEANIAYQMNDLDGYNRIMQEVVKTDPTNPELFYNLGIAASSNGQKDKAIEYYEKALELDPNYTNALINMGVAKLSREKEIVDEMNGLGTSRADNARYDVLKEERKQMYLEAVPYLEKAIASDPKGDNIELMKTLANIYSQVGEDTKYKALKAKIDALGN